jgi:tetratricopeptide (TPR) repeat protein
LTSRATRRLLVSAFTFSFAFGLGLGATLASAATEALTQARAERLAAAGRCEEALAALEELGRSAPLDASAHAVAGRCQMRLERHPDAARSFQAAKALDPSLPQLDLQLGIAQFLSEDIAGAEQSFAAARAAGTAGPEIDFYEALIALQHDTEPARAAATLERVGRERPGTLDPAASYYAGLGWRQAEDEERARAALERVVAEHPDTVWADAARKALERAGAAGLGVTTRPWASAEVGVEWNSNVAYLGQGLATPEELDSKSDVGGVWAVDVGTPIARVGDGMIGVRAAYSGSVYIDARDYDLQYPYAGVWFDHPTGEHSLFRLEIGGGYGWLGYDPYVIAAPIVSPQWYYDHGEWGVTRLHAGVARYDFLQNDGGEPDGVGVGEPCPHGETRCGPEGLDERDYRDRDGISVVAGVEHTFPLNDGNTQLRGGPVAEYYAAKGDEWDAWGVGGEIGVRQALPWQLTLDVAGRYVYRPYSNPSSYPDFDEIESGVQYALDDSDRRDHYVEVDVRLERPITRWLTASIRYDYLKNDSNVPVFDYDRHLVGGYLTVTWQGEPR